MRLRVISPANAGNAMINPAVSSLISKRAAAGGRGIALGLNNSFMSLGRIVGPVWAGFIFDFNIEAPYISGAIFMLMGLLVAVFAVGAFLFDRLRDNMKLMKKDDLEAILDKSLNQTLSRSIFTSLTVFLTVMSLFLFGGEVIRPFAFTMLVGVIAGSYSTIYQSCAWLKVWEKTFLKRKKS